MYGLIREELPSGSGPIAKYLARHLSARMYSGKVVIVAPHPLRLLGPLRKAWLQLIRDLQKERAQTLNPARIHDLTARIARMQTLKFTTGWHTGNADFETRYDVYLATPDQLLRWPPACRTMYITHPLDTQTLHFLTAWMPTGSLVVMCQ